jgi:hypothetical protein
VVVIEKSFILHGFDVLSAEMGKEGGVFVVDQEFGLQTHVV